MCVQQLMSLKHLIIVKNAIFLFICSSFLLGYTVNQIELFRLRINKHEVDVHDALEISCTVSGVCQTVMKASVYVNFVFIVALIYFINRLSNI
jgi:chloramphenicol O-acetyltransferase